MCILKVFKLHNGTLLTYGYLGIKSMGVLKLKLQGNVFYKYFLVGSSVGNKS